jgi:hypothetical protein
MFRVLKKGVLAIAILSGAAVIGAPAQATPRHHDTVTVAVTVTPHYPAPRPRHYPRYRPAPAYAVNFFAPIVYYAPRPVYAQPIYARPGRRACHPVSMLRRNRYGDRVRINAVECYDRFGAAYIIPRSRTVIHHY